MIYFLGLICFFLLSFIAILHFYWTVGGKWGLEAALPTKENGESVLKPKWIDCLLVGLILGSIALLLSLIHI